MALGRFVLRTKQYLAALRAKDSVLVLSTMLYYDEVVAPDELEVPSTKATKPTERELKMATQLVESLSSEFDPEKYHDKYREKVLAMIEAKADGEIIGPPEEQEPVAPVLDLMAALEASLANARKARGGHDAGAEDASEHDHAEKTPKKKRATA